jgi:hypothetical protein
MGTPPHVRLREERIQFPVNQFGRFFEPATDNPFGAGTYRFQLLPTDAAPVPLPPEISALEATLTASPAYLFAYGVIVRGSNAMVLNPIDNLQPSGTSTRVNSWHMRPPHRSSATSFISSKPSKVHPYDRHSPVWGSYDPLSAPPRMMLRWSQRGQYVGAVLILNRLSN